MYENRSFGWHGFCMLCPLLLEQSLPTIDATPTSVATPTLANTNPMEALVLINISLLLLKVVIVLIVSFCILFSSLYFISASIAAIKSPKLNIWEEKN